MHLNLKTTTFAARNVGPATLRRDFFCAMGAIEGTICFASDPSSLMYPKGLGLALVAPNRKNPSVSSWISLIFFLFTNSVQIHFIINSFWVFNLSCLISLVDILNWAYWILLKHKFDCCSFLWYCSFPSHSDQNH